MTHRHKEWRADFVDGFLTFEALDQKRALAMVEQRATEGEDFDLRYRPIGSMKQWEACRFSSWEISSSGKARRCA